MANGIVKKVPEDLVTSVLLRLPVKTLMRFKCVSKAWYSNVQSSTFISLHLNRTTRVNDEFILFTNSIKEEPNRFKVLLSFMSIDNDGDDLHPVSPDLDMLDLTTISSNLNRRPLGPCRGLIVLTDKVNAIIFNPATRHHRLLRPSPFGCPLGFHRYIEGVGFGFDSVANEYKIVRISEVYGEAPFVDFNVRERKVDVYELSMDSWRELNFVEQQLPQVDWYPCSEMFYKGASHWFGNTNMGVILCFDMSTEVFREMSMPNTCHSNDGKDYGLIVLYGSLTLICYRCNWSIIDPANDMMDIWIMEEYGVSESWIKKFTIGPLCIESPLAVWKDHLLLLQRKNGPLISYNLNCHEVIEFNLHSCPKRLRGTIYKECLILIPKQSEYDVS